MPIYEYFCPLCEIRFNHLARKFDEPAPACPNCGGHVEKIVSRVSVGRSEAARLAEFDQRARQIGQQGSDAESARFLKEQGGSLLEQISAVPQDAFQEILEGRARGASDEDLKGLAEQITPPLERLDIGARPTEDSEDHHDHDHNHDHSAQSSHSSRASSKRRSRSVGWG